MSFRSSKVSWTWPFGIRVAAGEESWQGLSGIQKFGYNDSVLNSFETIWDGGGIYSYPTSSSTCVLTSTSTDDNGSTVEVQGLDGNYDLLTETVTVGGSASTGSFHRIFRMTILVPNTGNTNVGTITATVDSATRAQINPGNGQTLMAIYTVPAGYRAYLLSVDGGVSKQKELTLRLITRTFNNNGAFQTKTFLTGFGQRVNKDYKINEVFDEKTDIEVQGKLDAVAAISAGFELLIEEKNLS